jgi:hypothetical protein
MIVTITYGDIKKGQYQHHMRNPIALAIQREVDAFAIVTKTRIHRLSGVQELPHHARVWLQAWDAGKVVTTFSLSL